ncbi:unnamed protein product [Clavelina lepadiformis]|uniref:Uncharacterized protein n=1 Tax=Clavelina lepadiformis TaxID=159417 RepID=A0ABP0G3Z0_CLALP
MLKAAKIPLNATEGLITKAKKRSAGTEIGNQEIFSTKYPADTLHQMPHMTSSNITFTQKVSPTSRVHVLEHFPPLDALPNPQTNQETFHSTPNRVTHLEQKQDTQRYDPWNDEYNSNKINLDAKLPLQVIEITSQTN